MASGDAERDKITVTQTSATQSLPGVPRHSARRPQPYRQRTRHDSPLTWPCPAAGCRSPTGTEGMRGAMSGVVMADSPRRGAATARRAAGSPARRASQSACSSDAWFREISPVWVSEGRLDHGKPVRPPRITAAA